MSPRWVVYPLTGQAHLVRPGGLTSRCGAAVLPPDAPVHDHPPGAACHPCTVILRADLDHSATPADPPAGGMKWALSVDDWHSHAVDERAEHPSGVYRAQCGHVLMRITRLYDERPPGVLCQRCATLQLDAVQAALDRAAAGLRDRGVPDFRCPVCNTLSSLIVGPGQAFCTNDVDCRVLSFNPRLPDGGLRHATVVNLNRTTPPRQHNE